MTTKRPRPRRPARPAPPTRLTEQRLNFLEGRVGYLDGRLESLTGNPVALDALGAMRADTAARFEKIEAMLLGIADGLEKRFGAIDRQLETQGARLEAMDTRLDAVDGRLDEQGAETQQHGLALERLEKMAANTLEVVNGLSALLGARLGD